MIKWALVIVQATVAGAAFGAVLNATLSPLWGFIVTLQATTIILGLLIQQRLFELVIYHKRKRSPK
jgi:hypothetical protein